MKRIWIIVLSVIAVFSFAVTSQAVTDSKTFTVSASIPTASGIAITAYKVNPTTNAFTLEPGLALNFNPLAFDSVNKIYTAAHIFAIDVAASGGAGTPTTTLTYTEGANPNGVGHGLGWKSEAAFVKVVGATESPMGTHPKSLLKDVSGDQVLASEVSGGFLRVYLGLVSGNPASTPAGGEPFTNADQAGTYDGTLLVSATVP